MIPFARSACVVLLTALSCFFVPLRSGEAGTIVSDPAEAGKRQSVFRSRSFLSHRPVRPLPTTTTRPLPQGPKRYVDPRQGDDTHDGSFSRPWKSLQHAVQQLQPGDTLCLRGGIYYEHVTLECAGTPQKPIVIRSCPGELAILDGGLREFFERPATAWIPSEKGVPGEFISAKAYPDLGGKPGQTNVLGLFGDSMIPLHGYRFLSDLRSRNMLWNIRNKVTEDPVGIYCGPGLFYDTKTGRIHVRLAHTWLGGLGEGNYRGEKDPRKIPLVIAGWKGGPALTIRKAAHVHLQDLVVRGSRDATVQIADSRFIRLEGMTMYGGAAALRIVDSHYVQVLHCACRGLAAPWTFRGHLKYRAIESRLFSASHWAPTGADSTRLELGWCEFTDSVDGIFVGNVRNVRFHHNLVENISDDALFLTANTGYDGHTPGGNVHVFQNRFSRCLTTFAFGVGHGRQKVLPNGRQTGAGVHIYRNVFDFRRPVMYQQPTQSNEEPITSKGRFAGDHGSPLWEPMRIYHNTLLADNTRGYDYGATGFLQGMGPGSWRRIFNNIVVQMRRFPLAYGDRLRRVAQLDVQIDGNVFWNLAAGKEADFLTRFRQSPLWALTRNHYPPGWGARDQLADPQFVRFSADWKKPVDLRLQSGSPAIDAGVRLPPAWPDPLKAQDKNRPDIGALPAGVAPWRIGIAGRFTLFGDEAQPLPAENCKEYPFLPAEKTSLLKKTFKRPVVILRGYPEPDAPIIEYLLRKAGIPVEVHQKEWLKPSEYERYRMVVLAGDLRRARFEPNQFTADDLPAVRQYLKKGGYLLILRRGQRVFAFPEGRTFLAEITGAKSQRLLKGKMQLQRQHPWLRHLPADRPLRWLQWPRDRESPPLPASAGDRLIATEKGACLLYHRQVGKGGLVYVGWSVGASLPPGRGRPTTADEDNYEQQVRILQHLLADIVAE